MISTKKYSTEFLNLHEAKYTSKVGMIEQKIEIFFVIDLSDVSTLST